VLQMSAALPEWRRRIAADLAGRGLDRDRVLALALSMLDLGSFRAGGEVYAEENNSFGIAARIEDADERQAVLERSTARLIRSVAKS
jgi:DNA topoisomerase-1